jgi:hypothetical protein
MLENTIERRAWFRLVSNPRTNPNPKDMTIHLHGLDGRVMELMMGTRHFLIEIV